MRQVVSYGRNFSTATEGKFTKYYSEDGSFEVTVDNTTGQEKHVLYIGGSPYEADILYLKDFTKSEASYHYLHKDYLGSILAITDENGKKLEQRHYDAWGNITHLKIGTGAVITDQALIKQTTLLLDRGYTSHEHFQELGIIHMNGRLYDPILRRFLNADENIQEPFNTQNYNKYGYVFNNPLLFNDPSGEFIFAPILIGALYGAVIGAGVAAISYSVKGLITGNWSLKGFGNAILKGVISGAISGAFSGLGSMLFSSSGFMMNSGTWDFLSNMSTHYLQNGNIDLPAIASSAIASITGSKIPGWKGVSGNGFGGWIKNAFGEIFHSALKYGTTGAISSGFYSTFRGNNIWKGMKNGFTDGAINGTAQSAFMISTFGATYKPTEKQLVYVKKMSEKYNVPYNNVKWRTGGIYNLLIPDAAVVWGNNISTTSKNDPPRLLGHEFGHIIQVQQQGWANFQAKGIWEQIFVYMIKGINPYITQKDGEQYNEYDAEQKVNEFYY